MSVLLSLVLVPHIQVLVDEEDFVQERKDRENAEHRAVKAEEQLAMKEKEYQRAKLTLEEELQAKNQQVKQNQRYCHSY